VRNFAKIREYSVSIFPISSEKEIAKLTNGEKTIGKKIKITVNWLQWNENGWMKYPTLSLPTKEGRNE
jgi:hypothetical protein